MLVRGAVREHQVTAGRQGVDERARESVRILVVHDEVHQRDQGERDGPVEVQEAAGVFEDRARLADVGLDVGGGALGRADEQGLGVPQHDRVVVGVRDAGGGRDRLHDLVQVRLRRDAGADVQELVDAFAGQPGRGALHEGTVPPRVLPRLRRQLLRQLLVDQVVVLASEQPVVDPRRMRLAGVDHVGFGCCRHT